MKKIIFNGKAHYLILISLIIIINFGILHYKKKLNKVIARYDELNFYRDGYKNFASEIIPLINYEFKETKLQQNLSDNEKIRFCIVIPSYNNEKYILENLGSIFSQNYTNWHLVYFDDASSDNTGFIVNELIKKYSLSESKFKYIRNSNRTKSPVYSFYTAAHEYCKGEEVMVNLDGDDMLAHSKVLTQLANLYSSKNILATVGSYIYTDSADLVICEDDKKIYDLNGIKEIRKLHHISNALRTYYTWLFKKIDKKHLQYNGNFYHVAVDYVLMFPMLEMTGPKKMECINDITYVYRMHSNNVRRSSEDVELESILLKNIREASPYSQLP